MSPNMDMHEAATHAGLSYERFRKVWPALVADEGLPAPIRGRVWDRAAVLAWRAARSSRVVALAQRPEAPAAAAPDRRRAAQRQLDELRRAG